MSDAAPTRPSLLLAVRNPEDAGAWRQFVDLYTPLVFGHCLKRGLQEADAADVSQEVMKAVTSAIQKFEYDRARGTFRGWLLTVTRSKLNNFFANRARHPQGTGDSAVQEFLEAQASPADEADWEEEFRRRVFAVAAERVRGEFAEKTWQAFWRTAVEHEATAPVAAELGLSVGAVYIARSRVIARLRETIGHLTEEASVMDGGILKLP
jgi:RNA polymerase sigma factor (sigma-70 family)